MIGGATAQACAGLLMMLGALPAAAPDLHAQLRRLDGSTISAADIDRTVMRVLDAAHITGAGIVVFNDGEIVFEKAYGLRDTQAAQPLTPDSVLTAASLTKPAFAYLVMQLVDDGALDLDKPVEQYLPRPLPEYPAYRDLADDPRYRTITARMLLDHTSGLPNWRWLEGDKKLRLHFAPGAHFAYSGEGIDLLQFVIETVARKPLQELMHERVFEPLQMQRTSMIWESRFEDDFANAYGPDGASFGPQRRTRADAAGGMQTTLHDYALFVRAAMRGDGLKRASHERMLAPQIAIHSRHEFPTLDTATTIANDAIALSYGLGWGLYRTPFGKAVFKEGHDDGLRHYVVYFTQARTGLLIMSNDDNGEGIYQELIETLLRNPYTPLEWERFTPYKKKTAGKAVPAGG
jgi:CubicO group peptidase (beta-lactamase class C family)